MSTPSCTRPPERVAPYVSPKMHLPCTGNAASGTTGPGMVVPVDGAVVVVTVVVVTGTAVVVVVVAVVGIVAKSGRQITSPGSSGVSTVASLVSRSEVIETANRRAMP